MLIRLLAPRAVLDSSMLEDLSGVDPEVQVVPVDPPVGAIPDVPLEVILELVLKGGIGGVGALAGKSAAAAAWKAARRIIERIGGRAQQPVDFTVVLVSDSGARAVYYLPPQPDQLAAAIRVLPDNYAGDENVAYIWSSSRWKMAAP